jgi:pSer/pThr/pTyr-binding forkhead associated (FHA) protein
MEDDFVLYDMQTRYFVRLLGRSPILIIGRDKKFDIPLPIYEGRARAGSLSDICADTAKLLNVSESSPELRRLIKSISPDHASIVRKNDGFYIADRDSNGTIIHPEGRMSFPLKPDVETKLNLDDRIFFGSWEVLFSTYQRMIEKNSKIAGEYKLAGERAA